MATYERTVRTPLTLGPEDDGRLVTAEEFADAEFLEPWVYERDGGRLLVMAPDGQRHFDDTEPWLSLLVVYRLGHRDVVDHVMPGARVRVDGGTDRIGDLGVYLKSEQPVPPIPDRVPNLMYEIVSPGRRSQERDYVIKRNEYLRLGIREYVVIDASKRQLTVFSLAAGEYEERILGPGEVYSSILLPGLEVAVDDVF